MCFAFLASHQFSQTGEREMDDVAFSNFLFEMSPVFREPDNKIL